MPHPAGLSPSNRGPLLVRLCNWVGEVALSVPAIRRLEAAGFDLQLYGKGWAPSLLEGMGLPVTVRGRQRLAVAQLRQLNARMRGQHPGSRPGALLFTRSFSSAVETRLAGFRPVGYAHDGRQLFLHEAYPRPRGRHAGEEYWQVVNAFLREELPFPTRLDLHPSPRQTAAAAALLDQAGVETGRYVVLCPFSGSDDREDRKVWPGFAELARRLSAQGRSVVVCPGPGEEDAARARAPGAVLLPGVELGTYAALLAMAQGVVANDTGPAHMAAGVGAHLVCVHGPPSTAAWTPVGPRVALLPYTGRWASVDEVGQALG